MPSNSRAHEPGRILHTRTSYGDVCRRPQALRIGSGVQGTSTDAADEMIKYLTRAYNRARQGKITQEIAEIVGGSEAL